MIIFLIIAFILFKKNRDKFWLVSILLSKYCFPVDIDNFYNVLLLNF